MSNRETKRPASTPPQPAAHRMTMAEREAAEYQQRAREAPKSAAPRRSLRRITASGGLLLLVGAFATVYFHLSGWPMAIEHARRSELERSAQKWAAETTDLALAESGIERELIRQRLEREEERVRSESQPAVPRHLPAYVGWLRQSWWLIVAGASVAGFGFAFGWLKKL